MSRGDGYFDVHYSPEKIPLRPRGRDFSCSYPVATPIVEPQMQAEESEPQPISEPEPQLVSLLPSLPAAMPMYVRMQMHLAQHWKIPRSVFKSRSQKRETAHLRQAAMWLLHQALPDVSLPLLGQRFDRDYTTVQHAFRAVEKRREANPAYKAELVQLLTELLEMKAARV